MLGSNRFTNNKSVIKRFKLLFKISQDVITLKRVDFPRSHEDIIDARGIASYKLPIHI